MSVDGIRPFPWQGGYDVSSLSLSLSFIAHRHHSSPKAGESGILAPQERRQFVMEELKAYRSGPWYRGGKKRTERGSFSRFPDRKARARVYGR